MTVFDWSATFYLATFVSTNRSYKDRKRKKTTMKKQKIPQPAASF